MSIMKRFDKGLNVNLILTSADRILNFYLSHFQTNKCSNKTKTTKQVFERMEENNLDQFQTRSSHDQQLSWKVRK